MIINLGSSSIALSLSLLFGIAQAADKHNIVLFGATGNFGGKILPEALNRGHHVDGVSRNPSKFEGKFALLDADFTSAQGDITDYDSALTLVIGADVVVVSVMGVGSDFSPESAVAAVSAKNMLGDLRGLGDAAPHVI